MEGCNCEYCQTTRAILDGLDACSTDAERLWYMQGVITDNPFAGVAWCPTQLARWHRARAEMAERWRQTFG